MKMAKASKADLEMALMLCTQLETLERGYFPMANDADDFVEGQFDSDSADDCRKAIDLIMDTLQRGSLFRVVFGMSVLLDPKNEAIDHSLDYLEHHPKVNQHDELVSSLRALLGTEPSIQVLSALHRGVGTNTEDGKAWLAAEALLAKLEG